MKLREVLELTQTVKLAIIAKERLDFGEKKAVAALKMAGCYSISGKPGWHFNGDESVLEKSIYDFVPPTKRKAKADNAGEGSRSNTGNKTGNDKSFKTHDDTGKELALKEVAAGFNSTLIDGSNVSVKEDKETGKETGIKTSKDTYKETSKETDKDADILDRLFEGLPATVDKKEVSFYLTHDVIEVINRAKKGNRSDLVNEALRKVFREKGWM